MVAQLRESLKSPEPLVEPARPPRVCAPRPDGFRINKKTDQYELTPSGREATAVSQRMVLRYALGLENRAEISHRYGYAARHVQSVISGQTYSWLTRPIRDRLNALGIVTRRAERYDRVDSINRALQHLSITAVEMIRYPQCYSDEEREAVALDLYLISGAWREDES